MTNFNYTFLPFLRQGMGGLITDTDNQGSGTALVKNRASVIVKLQAKGKKVSDGTEELLDFDATPGVVTEYIKNIDVFGPGDIVGVNKDAVVRTDPEDWITNFEPNYLPYIEFWDEDFPWRYTPVAPSGSNDNEKKLRPWLTLVALKEDEFEKVKEFNGILPSFKIKNKKFKDIFPSELTMWAWASVHINDSLGDGSVNINTALGNLDTKLRTNPALAVSRILCPRRLEANMGYYCFLIPTFEMGRQAGLGTVTETNLQAPAWTWLPEDDSTKEFPYYYEWFFKTGTGGDFEALANLLQPVILDSELVGKRLMDIQDPGNIDLSNASPLTPDTTYLQGALRPARVEEEPADPWWSAPTSEYNASDYKTALKNFINTSTTYLTSGTPNNEDPVITPPMYGRWHAKVNALDTAKSDWLNKINLDPKYRVMANAGAETVRKNQEEFMQMAWEQVKEVEEANRLINQLELGMDAGQAVYEKSYETSSDEAKLLMSSNVHARVIGENSFTVYKNVEDSVIPNGCFSGAFIKASRSNGFLNNNFSVSAPLNNSSIISNLNSGTIAVAQNYATPMGQISYSILQPNMMTSGFTISQPGRPYFGLTVPSSTWYTPGLGPTDSPMASAFRGAVAAVHNYIGNPPAAQGNKPALGLSVAATAVSDSIRPTVSILNLTNNYLDVTSPNGSPVAFAYVKPVMACPKIELPMFKYLYDISPDFVMPNLNALPQNSVSLTELNMDMIESYMVGLNHEMASELLWREYPTDQRGTVFSKFWQSYVSPGATGPTLDKTRIIKPIHLWRTTSPAALTSLGVNQPSGFNAENVLVLGIRGELLKKYPNTIVYAQKAAWQPNNAYHLPRVPDETNPSQNIKLPIFFSQAGDIVFFGFEFTELEARGTTFNSQNIPANSNDTGWFFVFKEMIGEIHYGLDEFAGTNPIKPTNIQMDWDDLNWGHMGASVADIKFVKPNITFNSGNTPTDYKWNRNAADFAALLLRKPAMVCIHAKELLS